MQDVLQSFIAEELKCSKKDVQAMVIGGHGDLMVPLPQYATVSGIPLTDLLPGDKISRLVERTVNEKPKLWNSLNRAVLFMHLLQLSCLWLKL